MEFVALVLGVRASRRFSHSALPDAEVRPPAHRWQRVRRVVRRGTRSPSTSSGRA